MVILRIDHVSNITSNILLYYFEVFVSFQQIYGVLYCRDIVTLNFLVYDHYDGV